MAAYSCRQQTYHEKTSTQTQRYNTMVSIHHIVHLCSVDTADGIRAADAARRSPWVSGRCGL